MFCNSALAFSLSACRGGFAQSLRFFAGYLPAFRAGISHAERDFSPPARRGGPCKAFEAHGLTALGFFRTSPYRSEFLTSLYGKSPALRAELQIVCGEREIRTPDTLLGYTRFPGVPLKPLEHLSNNPVSSETECKYTKNPLITTFPASVFQYMPQSCAIRAESECSEGNEARIGRSRCSGLPGGLSR